MISLGSAPRRAQKVDRVQNVRSRVLQQTVVAHAASVLGATKFLCGGGSSEKGEPSPADRPAVKI
jgi:hypothetical protein